MRLRREMIEHIARKIVQTLSGRDLVRLECSPAALERHVAHIIEEDLLVEDRLNEEVKEILRAHEMEMEKSNVDYSRMFALVKNRLVRERSLIL